MSSFTNIENAFKNVKNTPSEKNLEDLSGALTSEFKKSINCKIISSVMPISKLVMSVYPDISTFDRIISYAANNTNKIEAVIGIWQGANFWTMEINQAVLKKLTPAELTALSCHEVWHIIYSDRTIGKLKDSLSFMINTASKTRKTMITMDKFRSILRIPGLIACQLIPNKNNLSAEALAHKKYLDTEIHADMFSAKNGYRTHLISAIEKISSEIGKEESCKTNSVESAMSFSAGILDDLGTRKNELAKNKLGSIAKMFPGTMVGEEADLISNSWFNSGDNTIIESAQDSIEHQVFMELGLFTKRLPPIENNQIDYIGVKCSNIQTVNDQIMVVSYANSKIEIIDYYINILSNKSLSRRYIVPHTMADLNQFKSRLELIKEKALNMRVAKDNRSIIVYYPDQYKG